MITSVIKMLKLPNFGHMIMYTIQFESHYKILLVTTRTEILITYPLFQNTSMLGRPRAGIFADINKILTMFINHVYD